MKAHAKPKKLANAKAKTKVTVTVKQASGSVKPTGKIKIMRGHKVVATGTLKKGKVTLIVKGTTLKKGKNKLVVKYVASGNFTTPKKSPSITIHPHEVTVGGGSGLAPAHHRTSTPTTEPREISR